MVGKPLGMELEPFKLDIELAASCCSPPIAFQSSRKLAQRLARLPRRAPRAFGQLPTVFQWCSEACFQAPQGFPATFQGPPPPPCMVRKPLDMELEPSKLDIELAASGGSCPQTLDPMAECLASPKRAFQCFGYHSSVTISVSSGIGDLALCRQQEYFNSI